MNYLLTTLPLIGIALISSFVALGATVPLFKRVWTIVGYVFAVLALVFFIAGLVAL